MPANIPSALLDHYQEELTTLAECYEITRSDGTVMRFTSFDSELEVDGETYYPMIGERTSLTYGADLTAASQQVNGVLDDDLITHEDILLGKYDGASIRYFKVNWASTGDGVHVLQKGTVTALKHGRDSYEAELAGNLAKFNQEIGSVVTPHCQHVLGDSGCRVDLQPPLLNRDQEVSEEAWFSLPQTVTQLFTVNPGFETGDSEWGSETPAQNFARWDDVTAAEGTWFFGGIGFMSPGQFNTSFRDFDISTFGLSDALVDQGNLLIQVGCYRTNRNSELDLSQWEVEARNASNNLLALIDQSLLEAYAPNQTPVLTWKRDVLGGAVPVGTRFIRVRLRSQVVVGGRADGIFDFFSATVIDSAEAPVADRLVKCVSPGITGVTAPSLPAIGEEYDDGTARFKVFPMWVHEGLTVDSVLDGFEFSADAGDLSDASIVDNFFQAGIVQFTSGELTGAQFQVSTYERSPRTFVLRTRMSILPSPGDQFTATVGCNQSPDRCNSFFDNIRNYGGFLSGPGIEGGFGQAP